MGGKFISDKFGPDPQGIEDLLKMRRGEMTSDEVMERTFERLFSK